MLVIKKLYGIIIHGAIIHVKVAAYFASLEPAQPRPQSGTAAFVPKPSALQAGKNDMATLLLVQTVIVWICGGLLIDGDGS